MAKKPKSAEIHQGPGFRIRKTVTRPAVDIINQYGQFETPDISDLLNRMYTMSSEIHNLASNLKILGPACTVKVYPGDNLMVHKALDVAKSGDVIVVDAGGIRTSAVLGDLISLKAKHRNLAGFIVDGFVRDLPGIKQVGFPVFARGVTPIGPLHRGPGELNYPISCGGIVVNPGDIIVGDTNGVVVVRKDFSEEILSRLYAQKESLANYVADVQKGIFSNEWVDDVLEDGNCQFID